MKRLILTATIIATMLGGMAVLTSQADAGHMDHATTWTYAWRQYYAPDPSDHTLGIRASTDIVFEPGAPDPNVDFATIVSFHYRFRWNQPFNWTGEWVYGGLYGTVGCGYSGPCDYISVAPHNNVSFPGWHGFICDRGKSVHMIWEHYTEGESSRIYYNLTTNTVCA
ncbi:MAG: hypothetical protein WD231_04860 [Candidatus Woykebacteria bacterium]